MSIQSRHVDMLESEISGKIYRVFLAISWDLVNKQYVVNCSRSSSVLRT